MRGQIRFEPNDHSDVLVSAYYIDADFRPTPYEHGSVTLLPDGVTVVFLPPDQPNPLCPGTPGADCLGYQDRDGDPFAQDNDRQKRTDLQKFGSSVTVDWNLDGATLTSITGYEDVDKLYEEDADAGPVDGIKVDDFATASNGARSCASPAVPNLCAGPAVSIISIATCIPDRAST